MRAAGRLALAVLVTFHTWLLWTHFVGGKPLDLETTARWMVAVVVLVGFRALYRLGVPVFWGKRAVVLWLLVVVIHCHAVWNGEAVSLQLGIPETISILAQLTPVAAVLGLLFVGRFAAQFALWEPAYAAHDGPPRVAGAPSSSYSLRFLPRPPPLR